MPFTFAITLVILIPTVLVSDSHVASFGDCTFCYFYHIDAVVGSHVDQLQSNVNSPRFSLR